MTPLAPRQALIRTALSIVGIALSIVWSSANNRAVAQLRVVTYNTNTFGTEAPGSNIRTVRPEADIVFEALGEESVNGIARPADIILLQEQQQPDTTTQDLVNRLNAIYNSAGITYARGFEIGRTTSGTGTGTPNNQEIRQSVVYRTDSVQLINEESFGNISTANQPRETLLHQFRPLGYGADSDLFIFNSHFEASTDNSDLFAREAEATDIRNYIDSNGLGTRNVIVAGDFNVRSNFETSSTGSGISSLGILTAAGPGRVVDPLNPSNANLTFHNNSSIAEHLTQSPSNGAGALIAGGIDDRFDFLLQSDELRDGGGVAAIPNSLHTFGNNGSTYNTQINNGNTITFNGITSFTKSQVLNALEAASDHLPVVQDFQLPAILSAQLDSIPATVPVGATANVNVLVENIANVMSSLGADGLDYTVSVSGDLQGSASGTDFALGGFNSHPISLDTSTPGPRSGIVTVSSASQGAGNALVNLLVNFSVGGGGGRPVFGLIAKDDFDSTLNRTAFSQTPTAGTFSSAADGFQKFQADVDLSIPFALVDDTFSVFPTDQQGIVDTSPDSPGFKSDAWFGVVDVDNPDNLSGEATASWSFDISGAAGIEVSIDMAAMGDFDVADEFEWTYAINGAAAQPLFTSSIDEAGSATYTLADGGMFTLDDPLLMTNAQNQTTQLSNNFQTLTSLLDGTGDLLTLELTARTNGNDAASFNSEAYAFDNIAIKGFTGADADFDQDQDVDGADFLAWQRGFGSGSSLAEGDANGDGSVDDLDLAVWNSQFGRAALNAQQATSAVPEPSSVVLAIAMLAAFILRPSAFS